MSAEKSKPFPGKPGIGTSPYTGTANRFLLETTEALPKPVKASNARSPNRKPRIKKVLLQWKTERQKSLYLNYFRITGKRAQARDAVSLRPVPGGPGPGVVTLSPLSRQTVASWRRRDPEFADAEDEIARDWDYLRETGFEEMATPALAAVERALLQKEDMKLAADTARWLLDKKITSVGRKVQLEHTGPGGGAIPIIHRIEVVTAAEPMRRAIVDGESRELLHGELVESTDGSDRDNVS